MSKLRDTATTAKRLADSAQLSKLHATQSQQEAAVVLDALALKVSGLGKDIASFGFMATGFECLSQLPGDRVWELGRDMLAAQLVEECCGPKADHALPPCWPPQPARSLREVSALEGVEAAGLGVKGTGGGGAESVEEKSTEEALKGAEKKGVEAAGLGSKGTGGGGADSVEEKSAEVALKGAKRTGGQEEETEEGQRKGEEKKGQEEGQAVAAQIAQDYGGGASMPPEQEGEEEVDPEQLGEECIGIPSDEDVPDPKDGAAIPADQHEGGNSAEGGSSSEGGAGREDIGGRINGLVEQLATEVVKQISGRYVIGFVSEEEEQLEALSKEKMPGALETAQVGEPWVKISHYSTFKVDFF